MYNCEFSCTYKDLEQQYLNKQPINKQQKSSLKEEKDASKEKDASEEKDASKEKDAGEEEEDNDDIYFLCEEVYRIEFLKCFDLSEFDETVINNCVKNVFYVCIDYEPFKNIIVSANMFLLMDDLEMAFMFLFSYNLLHLTHPCIKQLIMQKTIDPELIAHLENEILKLT